MNKLTAFIIKKYARISGEKKIRLGMSLSKMAHDVRKSGAAQTGQAKLLQDIAHCGGA